MNGWFATGSMMQRAFSPRTPGQGKQGEYKEPNHELSIKNFAISLHARAAAFARLGEEIKGSKQIMKSEEAMICWSPRLEGKENFLVLARTLCDSLVRRGRVAKKIDKVCQIPSLELRDVRGTENEGRKVAMHLVKRCCDRTLRALPHQR